MGTAPTPTNAAPTVVWSHWRRDDSPAEDEDEDEDAASILPGDLDEGSHADDPLSRRESNTMINHFPLFIVNRTENEWRRKLLLSVFLLLLVLLFGVMAVCLFLHTMPFYESIWSEKMRGNLE
jgi:hypothetical protein